MARSQKVQVDIVADASSYAAGIRKAISDTDKFNKATKRAGKGNVFGGIAKNALRAAAAIGSLYTVYDQGRKAVDVTTDLAKSTIQLTRTTGLSSKEASRFIAITKVRGIETQKLTTSFTILSKQIVAAQKGTESATSAFDKLGVSQDAIRRGDTQQVFLQAADGLSKLANGANKTALAAQLFGRGYQALFPILDMGSKGIQEQLRLAGLLGAEIGDRGVATFKEYATAQRTAMLAVMGLRVQLGTVLLKAFATVATAVAQFVVNFRTGSGAAGQLRDKLQGILNVITAMYAPLTQTRNGFANVGAAIATLGTVIAGVKLGSALAGISGGLMAIFSNPYLAGAAAIAAAVAAIGAAFFIAYRRSREFRSSVDGIYKAIKPALQQIGATARQELPKMARAASQAAKATAEVLTELKPIIVPVIKAMAKSIQLQLRTIGPTLSFVAAMARSMASAISAAKSIIGTAMRGISTSVDAAKNVVSAAFNTMRGAANSAASAIQGVLSLLRQTPAGKLADLIAKIGASGGVGSGGFRPTSRTTDQTLFEAQAKLQQRIDSLSGRSDKNAQRAIKRAESDLRRIQTELNKREAIRNAQDQLRGIIETAKDSYRAALEAGAQATFNNATALARMGMAARDAERERSADKSYMTDKKKLEEEIARARAEANNPAVQARYAARRAALEARYAAQQQAGNLEAADQTQQELIALEERYGPQRVQVLQDQLDTLNRDYYDVLDQRTIDSAQRQLEATQAGIDGQVDAWAGGLTEINNLLNNFSGNYYAWVAAINANLPFGLTFTPDPQAGATINPPKNLPPVKKPKKKSNKKRASGGMLSRSGFTLVGETGPEMIAGGNVLSATKTARMNGAGVTLNVYPQTTADDPVALARALGWQLATR